MSFTATNVGRNKACVQELTTELMDLQKNLQQHVEKLNSEQQTCTANSLSWMTGLRENLSVMKVLKMLGIFADTPKQLLFLWVKGFCSTCYLPAGAWILQLSIEYCSLLYTQNC